MNGTYGFKNIEVRKTLDIELLRENYENLLKAYEEEIRKNVELEVKVEILQEK